VTEHRDPREHPTRARILETFASTPGAKLAPADLAGELDESLSNVSYHFRVLEKGGELEPVDDDRLDGGQRAYRLPPMQEPPAQ
jgi:DNA-binding transcriptional ArsR family regulator